MRTFILTLGLTLTAAFPNGARAAGIVVDVDDVPPGGLVAGRVDLTAAARWCGMLPLAPERLAVRASDGRDLVAQFVPDPDYDPSARVSGVLVARVPSAGPARLELWLRPAAESPAAPAVWPGWADSSTARFEHDPKKQGGLPWRITVAATGKKLEGFRWNNRLHHRELGSFCACDDPEAKVERVAAGPVCNVVRVRGRYVLGGKPAPGGGAAVYDWYYFHDRPAVLVVATLTQSAPRVWHEVHALEFNYHGETLPEWAGAEPAGSGRFTGSQQSTPASSWGVVHDGKNGVGMFDCGQVLLYDGGGAAYVQGHGEAAWQEWDGARREFASWLWVGSDARPADAVKGLAQVPPAATRLTVHVDAVRAKTDALRDRLRRAPAAERRREWWRVEAARQLEAQGRLDEAMKAAAGARPDGWTAVDAGDLGLILERAGGGLRVLTLFDSDSDATLSPARPAPLFTITFKQLGRDETIRLEADRNWGTTAVEGAGTATAAGPVTLRWRDPAEARLRGLEVTARVEPDAKAGALRWTIAVDKVPAPWGVAHVVFPQVAVADMGPKGAVLYPKGSGVVERGVWGRGFGFRGTYPSGWTSMPFFAAYDETRRTGLYVGVHDPWGSTRDLRADSRPAERSLVLEFDHPAPDLGVAGHGFALSGQGVWQVLHGDWFDASVIYRDWVRASAKWFPKLGPEGRTDTPKWMRELPVWALGGGTAAECTAAVRPFAEAFGTPAAVHWYNWHEIPFDNDYPHYFPTRPGFAAGVKALQDAGTAVMPYINGRLWDTHDRGNDDFEFTRVARPAVSKDEKGEPYVESYGSKEKDGSTVKLGVMCPTTEVWRSKVKATVLRLMNECGVKGVYIDQIAAAAPTLCFDRSHGHPLGGGHWWTEGYWRMLSELRKEMPPGRMITTECNGEPYVHVFDGYLTWHWQYDGQVPAFPAVYSGAVQMFGRSYAGGPTKDLALRMRAGQQLVFGEQIGWVPPGLALEANNRAFFAEVVALRRRIAPDLAAGVMARPPRILARGGLPQVRADWQWGGVDWVTTDAVMAGAWHRPSDNRLVLVFVNVSDAPVTATVDFDATRYGLSGPEVRLTTIDGPAPGKTFQCPPHVVRLVTFPPRHAWAWEVSAP